MSEPLGIGIEETPDRDGAFPRLSDRSHPSQVGLAPQTAVISAAWLTAQSSV
jgi:hypothetical protein